MATKMDEGQLNRPAGDRRGTRRHRTVLLVGQVRHRGNRSVCLVHDISPDGVMVRFNEVPIVGEEVEIAVRGLAPVPASVRWVKGYKAGLAFAVRQDLSGVLGRTPGKVPRVPRFEVSLVTQLCVGDEKLVVELIDLSPGGAKLTVDRPMSPGSPVQLMLPGAPAPLHATVCWYRDGNAGLRFTFALEMGLLAAIIALDEEEKRKG